MAATNTSAATRKRATVGLRLSEAAELLEVSPSTLRRYVKAGKLKATQTKGKYGAEYRIHPAVLRVWALDTLGLEVSEEELEGVEALHHTQASPPPSLGYTELYERLLELTEQATRYKTLSELSESTLRAQEEDYKRQIAELSQEKKTLEERIQTLEARKGWSLFRRRG